MLPLILPATLPIKNESLDQSSLSFKCGFANVGRLRRQIQGILFFSVRASTSLAPSLECSILFLVVRYDDSSVFCMSGRLLAPSGGLGRSISRGCRAVDEFGVSDPDRAVQIPPPRVDFELPAPFTSGRAMRRLAALRATSRGRQKAPRHAKHIRIIIPDH